MPAAPKSRRASRWLLLALLLAVVAAVVLSPSTAPWLVERKLRDAAERRGLVPGWSRIEGSIFDVITIHGLHLVDARHTETSTDLWIGRVEITPRISIPYFRPAESFAARVVLDGVRGRYVSHATSGTVGEPPAPGAPVQPAPAAAWPTVTIKPPPFLRWLPEDFALSRSSFQLVRGTLSVRFTDLRVNGDLGRPGFAAARETDFTAGSRRVTLPAWRGVATWRRPSLALAGVELGNGVRLVSASLDLSRIAVGRLDADIAVEALSGKLRGQVGADFTAERPAFDVVGTLENVAVEPVAKLLGGGGPFAGRFDQGQFSFRGDPGDPLAASSSLRLNAREFRWKERRFQSLAAAATLVNRRVQVQQFDLRQEANAVSLTGETTLPERENPPVAIFGSGWMIPLLNGFTLTVQAKLEDLKALGTLLDPAFSDVTGRASVEGTIKGRLGDFDGYLNLEGGNLVIRTLPLDFLKATLGFKGEEIALTDLQSTSGKSDYLTGSGSWQPLSSGRYAGELKAQIADLGRYAPTYVGALVPGPLAGALKLEWSGDGNAKSHSGAFKAAIERFSARRANAKGTVARPVNLTAEGSYSPPSLAFRQLLLRDGKRDAFKLEGSLPWLQDRRAWSEGRLLDPTRPISIRIEGNEAPLDLLPFFVPALKSADGRATGKLEITGSRAAPRLAGSLRIKGGATEWNGTAPALVGLEGDLKFTGGMFAADNLRVKIKETDFTGGGSVSWDNEANEARLDLGLKAEDFPWIATKDVSVDAALDLQLTGSVPAFVIGGEVKLADDGRAFRTLGVVEAAAEGRIDPVRATSFVPTAWIGPASPLGERRLDLHLATLKPLPVEAPGGGLLALDLHLSGSARAPQVTTGELRLSKGRVAAPAETNGSWELDTAVFTFGSGPLETSEPLVALTARKRSGKNLLAAQITGFAATFSSEPPGPLSEAISRLFLRGTALNAPAEPAPEEPVPGLRVGWRK